MMGTPGRSEIKKERSLTDKIFDNPSIYRPLVIGLTSFTSGIMLQPIVEKAIQLASNGQLEKITYNILLELGLIGTSIYHGRKLYQEYNQQSEVKGDEK